MSETKGVVCLICIRILGFIAVTVRTSSLKDLFANWDLDIGPWEISFCYHRTYRLVLGRYQAYQNKKGQFCGFLLKSWLLLPIEPDPQKRYDRYRQLKKFYPADENNRQFRWSFYIKNYNKRGWLFNPKVIFS